MIDIEDLGEIAEKIKQEKGKENFSLSSIAVVNFVTYSGIACGSLLYYKMHFVLMLLFLAMSIKNELQILLKGCKNCYYFGKRCATGKGAIAKLIGIKKGNEKIFACRKFTMKQFLPSILATNGAIVMGIVLCIFKFSWMNLGLTFYMIVNSYYLNGKMHDSKLMCNSCKMKDFCPAQKFFADLAKKNQKKK